MIKLSVFSVLLFLVFNLPRIVINIIDIRHHHFQLKGSPLFLKCFKTMVINQSWISVAASSPCTGTTLSSAPATSPSQSTGWWEYWCSCSETDHQTSAPWTLSYIGSCFPSLNPGCWRSWNVTPTVVCSQVRTRWVFPIIVLQCSVTEPGPSGREVSRLTSTSLWWSDHCTALHCGKLRHLWVLVAGIKKRNST